MFYFESDESYNNSNNNFNIIMYYFQNDQKKIKDPVYLIELRYFNFENFIFDITFNFENYKNNKDLDMNIDPVIYFENCGFSDFDILFGIKNKNYIFYQYIKNYKSPEFEFNLNEEDIERTEDIYEKSPIAEILNILYYYQHCMKQVESLFNRYIQYILGRGIMDTKKIPIDDFKEIYESQLYMLLFIFLSIKNAKGSIVDNFYYFKNMFSIKKDIYVILMIYLIQYYIHYQNKIITYSFYIYNYKNYLYKLKKLEQYSKIYFDKELNYDIYKYVPNFSPTIIDLLTFYDRLESKIQSLNIYEIYRSNLDESPPTNNITPFINIFIKLLEVFINNDIQLCFFNPFTLYYSLTNYINFLTLNIAEVPEKAKGQHLNAIFSNILEYFQYTKMRLQEMLNNDNVYKQEISEEQIKKIFTNIVPIEILLNFDYGFGLSDIESFEFIEDLDNFILDFQLLIHNEKNETMKSLMGEELNYLEYSSKYFRPLYCDSIKNSRYNCDNKFFMYLKEKYKDKLTKLNEDNPPKNVIQGQKKTEFKNILNTRFYLYMFDQKFSILSKTDLILQMNLYDMLTNEINLKYFYLKSFLNDDKYTKYINFPPTVNWVMARKINKKSQYTNFYFDVPANNNTIYDFYNNAVNSLLTELLKKLNDNSLNIIDYISYYYINIDKENPNNTQKLYKKLYGNLNSLIDKIYNRNNEKKDNKESIKIDSFYTNLRRYGILTYLLSLIYIGKYITKEHKTFNEITSIGNYLLQAGSKILISLNQGHFKDNKNDKDEYMYWSNYEDEFKYIINCFIDAASNKNILTEEERKNAIFKRLDLKIKNYISKYNKIMGDPKMKKLNDIIKEEIEEIDLINKNNNSIQKLNDLNEEEVKLIKQMREEMELNETGRINIFPNDASSYTYDLKSAKGFLHLDDEEFNAPKELKKKIKKTKQEKDEKPEMVKKESPRLLSPIKNENENQNDEEMLSEFDRRINDFAMNDLFNINEDYDIMNNEVLNYFDNIGQNMLDDLDNY